MKRITKTFNVYKFKELAPSVQRKVIDELYDINTDCEWWQDDYLLDIQIPKKYQKEASVKGGTFFSWDKIYFDLDREDYIQFEELEVADFEVFRKILRIPKYLWKKVNWVLTEDFSFHIHYKGDTTIIFETDNPSENKLTEREEKILERAKDIFDEIINLAQAHLKKWYEELIGDEAIKETIEANEYEFLEDGSIFHE